MERRPDGWAVYYSERGQRTSEGLFDNEADACAELHDRLMRDATTRFQAPARRSPRRPWRRRRE
ncbi:hypothetical protein ABH931_006653 [Streptacidiphilus sp. MAP12-33]